MNYKDKIKNKKHLRVHSFSLLCPPLCWDHVFHLCAGVGAHTCVHLWDVLVYVSGTWLMHQVFVLFFSDDENTQAEHRLYIKIILLYQKKKLVLHLDVCRWFWIRCLVCYFQVIPKDILQLKPFLLNSVDYKTDRQFCDLVVFIFKIKKRENAHNIIMLY